ncbi:MAG: hypothetical protein MZU95_02290 [Desulfomicrobium escambiense]|nr:hypothetical protein [Desulfomicrobium escambiense]
MAAKYGVDIPTLCHVPGARAGRPCAGCARWSWSKAAARACVTACNYPLRGDAEIQTDTPIAAQGRKLIDRAAPRPLPRIAEVLKQLAERYGADLNRVSGPTTSTASCAACARGCASGWAATCWPSAAAGSRSEVDTSFGRLSPTLHRVRGLRPDLPGQRHPHRGRGRRAAR